MALDLFTGMLDQFDREVRAFGQFPSYFMGLANDDGVWEHYDGYLKVVDATGAVVADRVDVADYRTIVGESASVDSYLKSPYFKPAVDAGDPVELGMYRVGPLARLNVCETMGSPLADEALAEFRERAGGVATSSFFYHYARLLEVLAATEQMRDLLENPTITDRWCAPPPGSTIATPLGRRRRRGARCSTSTTSTPPGCSRRST